MNLVLPEGDGTLLQSWGRLEAARMRQCDTAPGSGARGRTRAWRSADFGAR